MHHVPTDGYSAESAYAAVQAMLGARHRFTALVAFNDAVATGALAALSDHGLSVPDDLSFISFGNGHQDFHRPQITSVTFDEERIALLAANRLIDRVEGAEFDSPIHDYLPLTLTIRQSTRRV